MSRARTRASYITKRVLRTAVSFPSPSSSSSLSSSASTSCPGVTPIRPASSPGNSPTTAVTRFPCFATYTDRFSARTRSARSILTAAARARRKSSPPGSPQCSGRSTSFSNSFSTSFSSLLWSGKAPREPLARRMTVPPCHRGGGLLPFSSPTVLGLEDPASDRGLPCAAAASNAAALEASRRAVASSRLICAGALRSAMGLEPKKSPASIGSPSKYSSSRSSSSSSSSVGLDAYVSSSSYL
mmetsp:Transcript_2682/g.12116  ORF Transcript_2682/g.12116 Transcript_2682/m.12116 type:complete len:242 (-) Transcript_2682:731-1456(-)